MTRRSSLFRWVAAAVILTMLVLNASGLRRIQTSLDLLAGSQRGGTLWVASQLEFEYLRLERELGLFGEGTQASSADAVRLRFDLLWSRRILAVEGIDGMPTVIDPKAAEFLPQLGAELIRLERRFARLQEQDTAEAQQLLAALMPFEEPIHRYVLAARTEQSEADQAHRDQLLHLSRGMALLGMVVAAASLLLIGLFLADVRRHRRQAVEHAALLEQTRAAYRAKSQFLSTVSHELRTPLTSIKGALGIIRGNVFGDMPARAQKLVASAYDNTERLIVLINDILDLEKSETGSLSYNFTEVDMGKLVGRAIEAHRNYLVERNIQFTASGTEAPALARADDGRMMQVLGNLISNAVKFSHQDGRVEIGVERRGGNWEISVRDHGVGISEEFQAKVFEKFTQEDSSDTRKEGGTGLGLSIAQRIVQDHGGSIRLSSRPGEGTTFFFTLPVLQAHADAASAA